MEMGNANAPTTDDDDPALSPGLPAKLICVEDDPTVLASVSRLLSRDFRVISARSATEAIVALDEHPDVAIVLADHHLAASAGERAAGNGLEFLARAQTKVPDAVRVIFSGHIDLQELVKAINTSLLHRFILKPWNNEYFRIQMLEALANHSTLREKRALETLSVTDSVTGARNHRYFQSRLKIEIERALRHQRSISLLMLDVDHFKAINDLHGHLVGDLVLQTATLRLLDQVRGLDTVARYGGDEFALILPDTDHETAMSVAERIRVAFHSSDFKFPHTPALKCTISVGVATWPKDSASANVASSLDSPSFIAQADAALYQAKRQGRNQTVGA